MPPAHLMLQHVPGVGDAPVPLPAEVPHGRLHAALQPVAHLTQAGHQWRGKTFHNSKVCWLIYSAASQVEVPGCEGCRPPTQAPALWGTGSPGSRSNSRSVRDAHGPRRNIRRRRWRWRGAPGGSGRRRRRWRSGPGSQSVAGTPPGSPPRPRWWRCPRSEGQKCFIFNIYTH